MKKRKSTVPMTHVIIDCRNGALDRVVPLVVAQKMYEEGTLQKDLTNHGRFCAPENGRCPSALLVYPQVG